MTSTPELPPLNKPLAPLRVWLGVVVAAAGLAGVVYLVGWDTLLDTLGRNEKTMSASVPAKDLPPYYQISAEDLTVVPIPTGDVTSSTVVEMTALEGRYTLSEIAEGIPVDSAQLVPSVGTVPTANTVSVALPATSAMALGGSLQGGDVVDIFFGMTEAGAVDTPLIAPIEDVLVLDVKQVEEGEQDDAVAFRHPYVVVIAVPIDRRGDLASRGAIGLLLITRAVPG